MEPLVLESLRLIIESQRVEVVERLAALPTRPMGRVARRRII